MALELAVRLLIYIQSKVLVMLVMVGVLCLWQTAGSECPANTYG